MNKPEEKTSTSIPKNRKWTPWTIAMAILWFIGLFLFFHGIGYSKNDSSLDFKAGYFIIGLLIIAPIYYYIHSTIESEKGFPLENFNKEIVVQDIKRHNISENIDLSRALIESFVFGVGKDQNDYANIFYNKEDIEFVKSKITVEYINNNPPILLTAYTNIDKITLKEIINKRSSTKIYFDKYIPSHYYIDLEFLQNWKIQKKSGK